MEIKEKMKLCAELRSEINKTISKFEKEHPEINVYEDTNALEILNYNDYLLMNIDKLK